MTLEDDLKRLERAVLGLRRVSTFRDRVEALRVMLATETPGIRAAVAKLAAPALGRELAAAVSAAWDSGIIAATRDVVGDLQRAVPNAPPAALIDEARAIERSVAESLRQARALAAVGAPDADVLAPVNAARNRIDRATTSLVNRAGNAGATAVADAAQRPTVWVAEVNACVTCLRYSGVTARPGESFPAGLTYGRTSSMVDPAPHPPAHPHCRCTVEVLNDQSYADSLRREADRSVLRGFSLESESMAVRVDAADRLVQSGVSAPKSVIAYAEAAVKRGEFTTRGRP